MIEPLESIIVLTYKKGDISPKAIKLQTYRNLHRNKPGEGVRVDLNALTYSYREWKNKKIGETIEEHMQKDSGILGVFDSKAKNYNTLLADATKMYQDYHSL